MKKFLTMLLALALCVGLAVPALAGGEVDVDYPYFNVYDLSQNSSPKYPMSQDAAGTGWSWSAGSKTMTLNGYHSGTVEFNGRYTEDLGITVALAGENTITGSLWCYEWGGNGSMTVTGNGALEVTSTTNIPLSNPGTFTMQSGTLVLNNNLQYSGALGGKVVVNGGTLEINAENGSVYDLTLNGGLVRYAGTTDRSYILSNNVKFNGGSLSLGLGRVFVKGEIPAGYTVTDGEGKTLAPEPQYVYNADDTRYVDDYRVDGAAPILFTGSGSTTQTPVEEPKPQQETAFATTQTVAVDGVPVEFQMYGLKDENGYLTNYVKVRDVAHVLNGTAAQFSVGWDGAVSLFHGESYIDNGSEMSTPYSGDRGYEKATAETKVNDKAAALDAILLKDDGGNGYTYYKLRDLGEALGFTVDWSAERGVFIETK